MKMIEKDLRNELKKNLHHIGEIIHQNPKEALERARQIRERASNFNLANEEAEAYCLEALCYQHLCEFKQAYLHAEKAIKLFIQTDNDEGQADAWSLMANIYLQLGLHDRAFECNIKSLVFYESINHIKGIGVVLNNIGLSYFHLGDNQNARRYFEKALAHREQPRLNL